MSRDMRSPLEFMNRHHSSILSDINKNKIPERYDKETFILWCLRIERYKHPFSKKPRKSIIEKMEAIIDETSKASL